VVGLAEVAGTVLPAVDEATVAEAAAAGEAV
jgi:hypothetical protein